MFVFQFPTSFTYCFYLLKSSQSQMKVQIGINKQHNVHWGINPPQKHPFPSFLPSPHLNLETVQTLSFLGNPPPLYWFFMTPPAESRIFQWAPKMLKFLILNTILSFTKVTKFLIKISQFEFLVMTEKNIFVFLFINFCCL